MVDNEMEQKREAIGAIFDISSHRGVDQVLTEIQGESNTDLDENQREKLQQAMTKLGGADRVRQLFGCDGEPYLTLYFPRDCGDDTATRVHNLVDRMAALWDRGMIAHFTYSSHPPTALDSLNGHWVSAVKAFRRWAGRKSVTLEPMFRKTDKGYRLPPVFMVVDQSLGNSYFRQTEVDSTGILGVFPHAHGEQRHDIKEALDRLNSGELIAHDRAMETEAPRDHGPHGSIKGTLLANSESILGEEWCDPRLEYHVGDDGPDREGQIDLLYRHEERDRFLLVEIKTHRDQIDKAIGQVLGYKYRFVADNPGIEPNDVDVTIAAPRFYPTHEKVCEAHGIETVNVPVIEQTDDI